METAKFKVGDKVKVIKFGNGIFNSSLLGKIYTVRTVIPYVTVPASYQLEEDDVKRFHWEEWRLELAKEPESKPEAQPKFKVGDKVKVIDASDIKGLSRYKRDCSFIGNTCTIRGREKVLGEDHILYSVEESVFTVFYEEELVPASQKIIITTDGKTTLARLYEGKKVVKSAESHCSPDDTFDFSVGANLAMERLTGVDERPRTEETAKAVNEWFSAVIKLTNNLADKWGVK